MCLILIYLGMIKIGRKIYYVYIMASISRVLYIGYTDCLIKRGRQHKNGTYDNAFSKKYKTHKLVYFEVCYTKHEALEREKELKGWLRKRKIELIEKENPNWNDLYPTILSNYYLMRGFEKLK